MIFFTKKEFLIDQFKDGIIDIHNHLLPGLDDGAATIDDTINIIQAMKECNIKSAIATPHIMEDFYDLNVTKIKDAFVTCKKHLEKQSLDGFLKGYASEYMIDHQFTELLDQKDFVYIKDKLLLTEFSYFEKPASVLETVFNLRAHGIEPILAHPERYRYLKTELTDFQILKENGFILQLNLLSISGYYGKDAFAKAKLLLENDMYDFMATDAHRVEHLLKLQEIQLPKKMIHQIKRLLTKHESRFN